MKKIILTTALAAFSIVGAAACGGKTEVSTTNKTIQPGTENKSNASPTSPTSPSTAAAGTASALVKDVYDDAMRRNCAAIPAKLTEEFKKEVGTSKEMLEALCDTFTDSGKLASVEIKGEELKGDAGTVKVALTYKDGKKEEKSENVKKSGEKWLMDS